MKFRVLLLLLTFAACNAQKKKIGGDNEKAGQHPENSLTLVASDSYSGTETAETLIIRDAKGLQRFYSQINRTRKPGLPVPDIDFSKEMVVIRCSGMTDDGAMPALYLRDETGDEIVLGIREMGSEPSSSAVTTPFTVYRMPITRKEVVVQE